MTELSKNIFRHEVACKCGCGFDTMDFETIEAVQDCCDYFAHKQGVDKVVLIINSGARCLEHNRKIGGSKNSQHLLGRAMDIVIKGVSPRDVYTFLDKNYDGEYGIGSYTTFTHIDTRSGFARW